VLILCIVEFWNARIAASNIPQPQSRIPHNPNTARFLERWFDWQRGYRVIRHEDGREEYQALLGERLADVAPGHLPRTLDELRAGGTRGSSLNEETGPENLDPPLTPTEAPLDIDPEDRLFDLDTSSSGINQPTVSSTFLPSLSSTPIFPPSSVPPSSSPPPASTEQVPDTERVARNHITSHDQLRRVAALRREVQRLRAGIERVMSGLHEVVPDSQDALQHTLQHTTNLTTRLENIEDFLRNPDNGTDHTSMDQILSSDTMDWSADGHPAANSLPSGPQSQIVGNAPMPSAGTSNMFNFSGPSYISPGWSSRQSTHGNNTQPTQNPLNVPQRQLLEARTQLTSARTNEQYQHHLVGTATATMNREQVQTALRRAIEHRERSERIVANLELSQRQHTHISGTREEIERQGNNYESPISDLFNNYGSRYQAAEERRRQERATQDTFPDLMARYAEQPVQDSTVTDLEHVRTAEDIRQDLQRGSHANQSRNHQSLEQLASRRQPFRPAGARQTVPTQTPQPQTAATYQTPYLSAYLRNNGTGSTNEQTLAALREILAATEASALSERSQARRAAAHRVSRARTDGGQHNPLNPPPGQYTRRVQHPPPPAELPAEITAMMLRQQEHAAMANLPGRAAAIERRLRMRREELGGHAGLYGSDEDDLSRSDIDRYIAAGMMSRPEPEPPKSLDKDDGRPEPLNDDDMVVKMECKICFAQIATIALLPCGKCTGSNADTCFKYLLTLYVGHLVMCKWCADEAVPSHKLDATAPASRKATCPVCRKRVKQKVTQETPTYIEEESLIKVSQATIYGGEAPEPKPKKMKGETQP